MKSAVTPSMGVPIYIFNTGSFRIGRYRVKAGNDENSPMEILYNCGRNYEIQEYPIVLEQYDTGDGYYRFDSAIRRRIGL